MIGIKRQCDNHSGEKVVIEYLNVTMTRLNVVDKWLFATDSRNRELIMIDIFELNQKSQVVTNRSWAPGLIRHYF